MKRIALAPLLLAAVTFAPAATADHGPEQCTMSYGNLWCYPTHPDEPTPAPIESPTVEPTVEPTAPPVTPTPTTTAPAPTPEPEPELSTSTPEPAPIGATPSTSTTTPAPVVTGPLVETDIVLYAPEVNPARILR